MLRVIDCLLDLIFVPQCAGCGKRMNSSDDGICNKCKTAYTDEQSVYCDFCGMEARICTCIPYNMMLNGCIDYRKLFFYKSSDTDNCMHRIVYNIKRKHNRALIKFFAHELCKIDNHIDASQTVTTYAPRSKKALNEYGYDQSALIAKYYAKENGYSFKKLFSNKSGFKRKEQKLLNYRQRAKNMEGAFVLCNESFVKGKNIVLIDDVVTSGATLGECVSMLYDAGAKSVICRSIAHTYKKNKHKND